MARLSRRGKSLWVAEMNDLKPLYIIGAGGLGREVAWLVERMNAVSTVWDFKGFIDDDNTLWGMEVDGYKIHGGHSLLEMSMGDVWCVFAVGNAEVRRKGIEKLKSFSNIHFASLIDPHVEISESVTIGEGSIICAGTIITVDVSIGSHCVINPDCTIGHDVVIGDFITLYPGVNVSGCVNMDGVTEIGVGTQIIQGLNIGTGVIVGAGSTIVRDIENDVTVAGSPARVIKRHSYNNKEIEG